MKKLLLFLLLLIAAAVATLWVRHGGGDPYPNLTTTPTLDAQALEVVLSYPKPIGNVAVNKDGRVFFTVHPESRPKGNKLLEYTNGASVPYPSLGKQRELFDTPIGVVIDRLDRLWVIDHGNHGTNSARIVAIDLATGEVLRDQKFHKTIAPLGSFLQDLQVSADGKTVIIADASFWRKSPALIVYDVETGDARRVLEDHASVLAENYVIRNWSRRMEFFGGIVALRGGVDGIALGPEWLYYAALSGSVLYRIRLEDLRNSDLTASQLASKVEKFSDKPLSDGLSIDVNGDVYITDIEHSAIFKVGADRKLSTLIQSRDIRWPDGLSFGPNAYLYIADSALSEVILKSDEHIDANAPYKVFRFQPGSAGVPGQ